PSPSNLCSEADKQTVKIQDSQWNFEKQRGVNFFINSAEKKYNSIVGTQANIDHYIGEGYFFRAYDQFRLLRNYGDCPVLREMLPSDQDVISAKSQRTPRNQVARAILEDLKHAAELMLDWHPETGRVNAKVAHALRARVALYEATWEKYHAGTCFVPGNDKWPGKAYWPDFAWPEGSAEAEINFFLDEAIKSAEEAVSGHPLAKDYLSMFNTPSDEPFGADSEVLLARYYSVGVLSHSCSRYLGTTGGGCGVTRATVNSFLMESGLPWYAAGSEYKGDQTSYEEFQNRDHRLTGSVRAAGSFINDIRDPETGKMVHDTIYHYVPLITNGGNEKSTTGYELLKWVNETKAQQEQTGCTTSVPLFRS
ncbi:MAG: RagB/SusD family nutrient uptake outer membrane protein, partial [Muribaculaceae bacterium]|nr:RagB/SusD family nutrient uptake outer membrane protein [Muribaculaceae bacterium]